VEWVQWASVWPAGLGAKIGRPDKESLLSLVMVPDDNTGLEQLCSILCLSKLLCYNNYLGMVRQWQDMFLIRDMLRPEMVNPDFI